MHKPYLECAKYTHITWNLSQEWYTGEVLSAPPPPAGVERAAMSAATGSCYLQNVSGIVSPWCWYSWYHDNNLLGVVDQLQLRRCESRVHQEQTSTFHRRITETFIGDTALCVTIPKLWNSLPVENRTSYFQDTFYVYNVFVIFH